MIQKPENDPMIKTSVQIIPMPLSSAICPVGNFVYVKSEIVNLFCFAVSVTATQLCSHCSKESSHIQYVSKWTRLDLARGP